MDPATIALILNTAGDIFGFFGKKKEEREDAGDLALTIGDDIAAYNQEILNIDTQIETAQLNQQMMRTWLMPKCRLLKVEYWRRKLN